MKNWTFLLLPIIIVSQLACSKDDDSSNGIPCHKTVIEGTWDVVSNQFQNYEELDSIVTTTNAFTIIFNEDGRGSLEGELGHFTWALQCNPDRLHINRLGGPPFEETDDDPMDYIAFTDMLIINKITRNNITLSTEYIRDNNQTRRNVTVDLTYTRVE